MRLIDADAAYKAACEGADNWDGAYSPYRYDRIREEMDKVPTFSPWHRVEDELPALKELMPRYFASGMCVLYNADTESFDTGFATKLDFGDAEIDWKALYVKNPTHWMPIEPPKEEN